MFCARLESGKREDSVGGLCYLMLLSVIFYFTSINENRLVIRSETVITAAKLKELPKSLFKI